jgi:hypothetical protein
VCDVRGYRIESNRIESNILYCELWEYRNGRRCKSRVEESYCHRNVSNSHGMVAAWEEARRWPQSRGEKSIIKASRRPVLTISKIWKIGLFASDAWTDWLTHTTTQYFLMHGMSHVSLTTHDSFSLLYITSLDPSARNLEWNEIMEREELAPARWRNEASPNMTDLWVPFT